MLALHTIQEKRPSWLHPKKSGGRKYHTAITAEVCNDNLPRRDHDHRLQVSKNGSHTEAKY